ncbi:MAG: exosortase K [Lachnospiraceae bacterium]|nr:exosortase K [Lachnospiraceae bacterium]
MKKIQIKKMIQNYWLLFTAAAIVALVMNHFCRTNDSDALKWILTPTARWVNVLSGITFEYLPHQGYVNHFHQFLIASSCAGSRFMLLTFLMLVFSFLISDFLGENDKYIDGASVRKEYLWFVFSMFFSYIATIFVNGIRITASIYLPAVLERKHLMDGWLTDDRLHTLIGTVTYFMSLCVVYLLASLFRKCVFRREKRQTDILLFIPAFWYLLVVLALPFVKRMYHNEWDGFGQYAAVIIGVCGSVCVLSVIGGRIRRWKRMKN